MVTIHFHCMGKKNSFNIIQNIFFCVQQKKVSQTGSEWHKNEQMMTTVISGELFHFLNQEILQRMDLNCTSLLFSIQQNLYKYFGQATFYPQMLNLSFEEFGAEKVIILQFPVWWEDTLESSGVENILHTRVAHQYSVSTGRLCFSFTPGMNLITRLKIYSHSKHKSNSLEPAICDWKWSTVVAVWVKPWVCLVWARDKRCVVCVVVAERL